MKGVHATAIIEEGVELGPNVEVGPYSYIRSGARIGGGTRIHSHVNIWGESTIGEENEIFPYCTIGAPPQIIGDKTTSARAIIGNKNVIREGVQIHRGSSRGNGTTVVGNENFLMTSVHIAHDCMIGNKVVIASKTGLSGHVTINDFAILSGACGVSQHVRIGSYAFCAGMLRAGRDVPPYLIAKEYSEIAGPNLVGLKRGGFKEEEIRVVKEIYKALYIEDGIFKEQLKKLNERYSGHPVYEAFNKFVSGTKLGLMGRG
jgi:UDP-N-acetylglucosamine acyltransferase